jgi:hypothetical protein
MSRGMCVGFDLSRVPACQCLTWINTVAYLFLIIKNIIVLSTELSRFAIFILKTLKHNYLQCGAKGRYKNGKIRAISNVALKQVLL